MSETLEDAKKMLEDMHSLNDRLNECERMAWDMQRYDVAKKVKEIAEDISAEITRLFVVYEIANRGLKK